MGYNHTDIGHNWAHQLKSRQGDRYFSFDGSVIKSYTTVIGEIVHTKDGTPVFFLNTGSYSHSTCKHQHHAFSAIPNSAVQFSASCGNFMYNWDGITNWDGEITESQAKEFVVKKPPVCCQSFAGVQGIQGFENREGVFSALFR